MSEKELCDCGKMAVWCYMPGFRSGESPNFCSDCVPRGCDCNNRYVSVDAYHPPLDNPEMPDGEEGVDWKWIEKGVVWCYLEPDTNGKEYPCCEYMHDADGWDTE